MPGCYWAFAVLHDLTLLLEGKLTWLYVAVSADCGYNNTCLDFLYDDGRGYCEFPESPGDYCQAASRRLITSCLGCCVCLMPLMLPANVAETLTLTRECCVQCSVHDVSPTMHAFTCLQTLGDVACRQCRHRCILQQSSASTRCRYLCLALKHSPCMHVDKMVSMWHSVLACQMQNHISNAWSYITVG